MGHTIPDSDTHFREIFEHALFGMYRTTPDGRILAANSALVRMLGYASFGELAQRNLQDLTHDPDHRRSDFRQQLERDGRVIGLESTWLRNDGSTLFVHENASVVLDEAGHVRYYEGVVDDMTDRKQAEKAPRESDRRFETLADATSEAVFVSEGGVCVDANRAAAEMFGYPISQLVGMHGTDVIAPEFRSLVERHMLGEYEGLYEAVGLRRDGSTFPCEIQGRMLCRGNSKIRITALRDVSESKRALNLLQEALVNLEEQVEERTADLVKANRRLSREVERHNRTEEALLRSESRLCNAQRIARLGFWEHDILHDRLYWSEEIFRTFGLPEESFAPTYNAFIDAVHPEDRELVQGHVDAARDEDAPYSIDHRIVLPSGEVRYVHEQGEVIRDAQGVAVRMMGTVLDITEHKRMVASLQASEERFRTLAESAHDLIGLVDSQGKAIWANAAWKRRFGDNFEKWEDVLQQVHPDDREDVARAWSDLVAHGAEIRHVEYRLLGPSDEYMVLDATVRRAECESPLLFWVALDDTTDEKSASIRLHAEKDRAQLLLDVAGVMLLGLDCDGKVAMINRRGREILGYEEPDIHGKDWFVHFLPADCRDDVRGAFGRLVAGELDPVEYVENVVLCADGTTRMMAWHNAVVRDSDGEIVGTLSSGDDITESRRAAEALAQSEEQYRTLVEKASDIIYTLDLDGRFTFVSPAVEPILGYAPKEVLGRSFLEFVPKEFRDQERAGFEATLQDGATAAEIMLIDKEGESHYADFAVNVIEKDGQVVGLRGIARDITDRKRWEVQQALALQLHELVTKDSSQQEFLEGVTDLLKSHFQFEAVGIRLRDGDEFPYFATRGWPPEFAQTENQLCQLDQQGIVVRDGQGNPLLECMCGGVIRGNVDPALPFFTEKGSFWVNDTAEFLDSVGEPYRHDRFLDRYSKSGYESVGLIPLVVSGEAIGLLQLNDAHKNRLPPWTITTCEQLADILATALAHRAALEQLRRSQANLARAQAVTETGSWERTLLDGKFQWSEEMYRILGISVDVTPTIDLLMAAVHDEDKEVLEHALAAIEEGGEGAPHTIEYRIVRPDGEERFVRAKASRTCDGSDNLTRLFGIVQDITEQRRMEEAMRASEARLSEAEVIAGVGSWDWDLTVDKLSWSDGLCRIFGIPSDEFGEKYASFLEFLPDDEFEQAQEAMDQAIGGIKPLDHIHRINRPDGQQRVIHAKADVIRDDSGRAVRVLGTARDITERKQTEDRLHQMETQLAHVARVSTLGEMMAGIAHEINQPLCSVQTLSEAVGNVLTSEKQPDLRLLREWNDAIAKAGSRAVQIIKRLRGFVRPAEPQRLICRINEIINEAAQLVAAGVKRHKAAVRLELSEASPTVLVDRVEIQQVVINLVQNALEAMAAIPDGQRKLSIFTALTGDLVEVSVADSGPGLPLDDNLRIFDAFVTTKSTGLGMGLAIATRIVESHAGKLSATSNCEGGATFSFTLPAVREGPHIAN